jgi:hypothetical protein
MTDPNRKEITEHTREAGGGDERDSQGDGVADRAVAKPKDKGAFAQPSTNREAVPDGLEGSIMDDEPTP